MFCLFYCFGGVVVVYFWCIFGVWVVVVVVFFGLVGVFGGFI